MALSDTAVRTAKPRERAFSMPDGAGLYVWVTPAGGKLWRWGYKYSGKEKLMSFGKYPDVSLAMARTRHGDARRLLASGFDPMAQRKADKTAQKTASANSFASISALWLDHWETGKSPRHVEMVRRRMAKNVLPYLGDRPISAIEAPELVALTKGVQGRGVSDLAKRALENAGQVFRYAIAHGYATRNPASEIRPGDVLRPTKKRNLARIEGREFPTLLRKIEVYQGTHHDAACDEAAGPHVCSYKRTHRRSLG